MAELKIGGGDSTSRLLQTHANSIGLKRVWCGDGRVDSLNLVVELYNAQLMRDYLWKGLQELYSMPELRELPEAVQAKMMSIILHQRSCAELEAKTAPQPARGAQA